MRLLFYLFITFGWLIVAWRLAVGLFELGDRILAILACLHVGLHIYLKEIHVSLMELGDE